MQIITSLINSGIEYRQKDPAKALKFFMNAHEISEKHGNCDLSAESIFNAAIAHLHLANYRESLDFFNRALNSGMALTDGKFKSEVLRGIAANFLKRYNYRAGLKYLYLAEEASIESENLKNLNLVYGSFGSLYNRLKLYGKALEYAQKSLDLSRQMEDPEMIQYALMSVGSCYYQLNRRTEAGEYLQQSLDMNVSEFAAANALHFLSILKYNNNDFEMTLEYTNKQIEISAAYNFHEFEALGHRMIGDVMLKKNRIEEARKHYVKGMDITEKVNEKLIYFTICRKLIDTYELTGDSSKITPLYKKLYHDHIQHLEMESQLKIEQIDIELETDRIKIEIETEKINNKKLKKALDEVNVLNTKLERLNEEKNDFMATVVHDLKNPLHNMRSALRIMNSSMKEEIFSREYCENINIQIDRMLQLIGRLLDYKAIDEGSFKIRKTRFSVTELCMNIINDLNPLAQQKDLQITFEEESEDAVIESDYIILYHVMENLVSNAVKFSPKDKKILIRTYKSGNKVNFEVKDEGPGFTKKDQTKLYSNFARLSAQPTGNENSTGLGLSIVKKLCHLIDAGISLVSEEGNGAVFTITVAST